MSAIKDYRCEGCDTYVPAWETPYCRGCESQIEKAEEEDNDPERYDPDDSYRD